MLIELNKEIKHKAFSNNHTLNSCPEMLYNIIITIIIRIITYFHNIIFEIINSNFYFFHLQV